MSKSFLPYLTTYLGKYTYYLLISRKSTILPADIDNVQIKKS